MENRFPITTRQRTLTTLDASSVSRTPARSGVGHGNRQKGAALVTSLIILLMLTLMGVAAMQTTTLEEKMAGNLRNENLAFQAAEAALRAGEAYLQGFAIGPFVADTSETNLALNPAGLYQPTFPRHRALAANRHLDGGRLPGPRPSAGRSGRAARYHRGPIVLYQVHEFGNCTNVRSLERPAEASSSGQFQTSAVSASLPAV